MKDFILASGSPQRKMLLKQIDMEPMLIESADIDEMPRKGEKPSAYVKRMAYEKAAHVAEKHLGKIVLGSDTILVCAAKIIQKGLKKNKPIIAFPFPMAFGAWFMSAIPACIIHPLLRHLPKK